MRTAFVIAAVVFALSGCGPGATTEVRAGDRSFEPTIALVGRGTEIRDDINLLGRGGRRVVDVIFFLATDADIDCADLVAAEGQCGFGGVIAEASALSLHLSVRETLLGDGLGDYEVPSDALARLTAEGADQPSPSSGNMSLARFGDNGGAVSYQFEPELDGTLFIEPGAVVADRCAAIDAVFVDCE